MMGVNKVFLNSDLVSKSCANDIKNLLVESTLKFSSSNEDQIFSLDFSATKTDVKVVLFCGEGYLTIHAVLPLTVPEEKISELLNEINTLNLTRPVGNYEINKNNKKLVFKLGVNVPPLVNKDELVKLIMLAVASIDMEVEKIIKIIV